MPSPSTDVVIDGFILLTITINIDLLGRGPCGETQRYFVEFCIS